MEAKKLDYYKERLREKEKSLADMVHRTESYGREKEPDIQDMADMAVESYTKEFMFGKSSGDRSVLQKIREALARIDDRSYGTCVHCESPIQSKRLEAVPWASHCLDCQALLEKGLLDAV